MTANITLAITAGFLVACGVYLILERSLTRILIGVILISNGVNVLFLIAAGDAGTPPIIGMFSRSTAADPLPQAMMLTAIVITLAVSAFVLAMAYRSFQLNGDDETADDLEDARIRELAKADEASGSFEETTFSDTGEDVVSE
ncbi:Na(+)/H(+) antiporter subunit C [Yimella sp. cx-51]|uniref:Na(+)/H(+) antiporter subunit C n=1 Tax=Yimella sp. cx-51 TaxID=2770551 RepID=UPI00165DDA4D|nr:Na(+)/H(+) antiporter subunit C [Yimella sp. cx-51]MBC9956470.1 Na(+)/H(+) antiporter subunit C [Yimella sp. cx-51]QTH38417.1 Na(+)/H(+) antiporter subunit C [Yimella sp. cx-51]